MAPRSALSPTPWPARSPLRAFAVALAVALGVYVAVMLGLGGEAFANAVEVWVYTGLLVGASALCVWRAVSVPGERLPWLLLAAAPGLWAVGEALDELVLSRQAELAYPSLADALWLGSYVAACAGIVTLVRHRLRASFRPALWLDAAIVTTTLAAFGMALIFDPVSAAGAGHPEVVATDLAYPLGDVVLLGLVVSVLTLTGWRPGRGWSVFALALALQAVSDGTTAYRLATEGVVEASVLDALWPAASLLLAWAAWRPLSATPASAFEHVRVFLVPALFTGLALGLLVYDQLSPISDPAAGLAALALALAIARLGLSFRENLRMLGATRRLALTDPLTELANRRALMADLDASLAPAAGAETPGVLALFDLDGFKRYNDAYGHPAGDALLARLGRKLAATVEGRGRAYRLGGDEFCILLSAGAGEDAIAGAAEALVERGDGFAVTSSHGVVRLPADAAGADEALLLADRRLYAAKESGPQSAVRQSRDLLLEMISQREPELGQHVRGVTTLASGVARRLGLSEREREAVVQAAELHDIGKMAIPDAILNKAGPLDAEEWAFMRRHTIIGEEILNVAPALQPVAKLVRASHERWDGSGYPDGLAGAEIPLGARVVAVCDAFSAMTQDRPYQRGRAQVEALAEVERSAGRHFDPSVVAAFAAELAPAREPVAT